MDYNIITTDGNIAFYSSCEVTELFLQRKNDGAIFNFFTLVVYEESPYDKTNHRFLCKPIEINQDYSLGIQRYWFSKEEAAKNFFTLKNNNKWEFNGVCSSQFPQLKLLPKQFIPSTEENRLNNVLKNNFHSGSYIIEFFDEEKSNVDFLLKMEAIKKLNVLSEKIKQIVPIDVSVVRDRIGNFIFQFPITILKLSSRALKSWDGTQLEFAWHPLVKNLPDCLIQVESTFDKNYMGSALEECKKTKEQVITIGNLDQINSIKVWRQEPSLILSSFSGTYIKYFGIDMGIMGGEPRHFELEGKMVEIPITMKDAHKTKPKKVNYTHYIMNNLYDIEKKQLEKTLSFKQYKKGIAGGIIDLRKLIQQKDENGVYLWDPFLSSKDILNTLYFSITGGVQLKAIGSINDTVKSIYNKKGKSVQDIISEYCKELENPKNNNCHLNLEFRIQHTNFGWAFHDRFLIFPSDEQQRAQVYSLGTSVNSFGQNHHILQEVSHPQPIVDAFNELWEELDNTECIAWKYPK